MPLTLTQIDRRFIKAALTVRENGKPDIAPAVDAIGLAILGRDETPNASTTWLSVSYDGAEIRVMLAGPGADPGDALVVPIGRSTLWGRAIDIDEVLPFRIEDLTVT